MNTIISLVIIFGMIFTILLTIKFIYNVFIVTIMKNTLETVVKNLTDKECEQLKELLNNKLKK